MPCTIVMQIWEVIGMRQKVKNGKLMLCVSATERVKPQILKKQMIRSCIHYILHSILKLQRIGKPCTMEIVDSNSNSFNCSTPYCFYRVTDEKSVKLNNKINPKSFRKY